MKVFSLIFSIIVLVFVVNMSYRNSLRQKADMLRACKVITEYYKQYPNETPNDLTKSILSECTK